MTLRLALLALALSAVSAISSMGCSSESSTSSSQSFKCCVNGTYYDCKTEDQMKTCGTSTMSCPADSSKNDLCK